MRQKYESLQLDALAREESLLREIEVLKHERDEYQRNMEMKTLELQTNIEQQKRKQEEMNKRLNMEKYEMIRKLKEQNEDYYKKERDHNRKIKQLKKDCVIT